MGDSKEEELAAKLTRTTTSKRDIGEVQHSRGNYSKRSINGRNIINENNKKDNSKK